MFMTEHNARSGMICPMMTRANATVYCNGGQCPMWRYGEYPRELPEIVCDEPIATEEPARPRSLPADWIFMPFDGDDHGPACWIEPEDSLERRRLGYCGLAGKPEDV